MYSIPDCDPRLSVVTKYGTYIGFRDEKYHSVNFRNVQFGVAERWQQAEFPVANPGQVFEANRFGPAPVQAAEKWGSLVLGGMDEQCLNMNIFTKTLQGRKKAVMVWVFPGMQIIGSNQGSVDVGNHHGKSYDASGLVAEHEDLIVVIPNYRVGIFGSVNLSTMPDFEEKYRCSNNLARTDLLHALKWIHENIAAFGGDPDNVTLFGQSAGANNITAMLLWKEAQPYFHKAIIESSFIYDISATTWEDSITISREFFQILGVSSIEETLKKSDMEILAAQEALNARSVDGSSAFASIQSKSFSPVVDNIVIPDDYWEQLMANGAAGKKVMLGTTAGEYDQQFIRWADDPGAQQKARDFVIRQNWGKLDAGRGTDPEILENYLKNYRDERSEFEAYKDLKADLYLRVGAMAYAQVLSSYTDVYVYYFSYNFYPGTSARAPHGSEVSVIFRNDVDASPEFQEAVSRCWVQFARTGNPNNSSLPVKWEKYDPEHYYTLLLSEKPSLCPGIRMDDIRTVLPATLEYKKYPAYRKLWESSKGN
ncbi:MAG: carboxylesterase family protein [Clostridiales bacterium]|nr:carboxylesterase family protein [Clostridiales bacterium]